MAPETEHLKGIIEIETLLGELDQLLWKLGQVQLAIESVDDETVKVDFEERGAESLLGDIAAIKAAGVFGGGGGGSRGGRTAADSAADATAGLFGNFSELDIRMTDLHNALARLVPLILVIIGALPALIGGLVGLAGAAIAATAALAGIAGFGALGFAMMEGDSIMEGFQEILSQVREDFLDAFTPLAQQLAPLFEDALDGLDMFFQALASRGDVLRDFEQVARSFGAFLLEDLPDAIAFLGQMAIAFEPVFAAIGEFFSSGRFGEGFMQFMANVMSPFSDFMAILVDMAPQLMEMSIGFLRVTNAILFVINAFIELLTLGGMFNEEFGFLVGTLLALATATFLWNSALIQTAVSGIVSLMKSIATVIGMLLGYETSTIAATIATYGWAFSLLTLIGVVTFGVGAIAAMSATIGTVSSQFDSLTGSTNEATKAIRNFDRTTSNVGTGGPYAPSNTPVRANARSGSGGNTLVMNIEGDADRETVETQMKNEHHRLNKSS